MEPDEKTPLVAKKALVMSRRMWIAIEVIGVVTTTLLLIYVLHQQQGWSFMEASYVFVQIVTTVGYGLISMEIEKHPVWYQLFIPFYAVGALTLFAVKIGPAVDKVHTSRAEMLGYHMAGTGAMSKQLIALLSTGFVAVLFVLMGMAWFSFMAGYPVALSFYVTIITLTSIGFGDHGFNHHPWGKTFATFWILFGVMSFAAFLGAVAIYFQNNQAAEDMKAAEATDEIDDEVFAKIDRDGNGWLDRSEFLAFVLLKHEIIDEDLMDSIFKEYSQFEGARDRKVTMDQIEVVQRGRGVVSLV